MIIILSKLIKKVVGFKNLIESKFLLSGIAALGSSITIDPRNTKIEYPENIRIKNDITLGSNLYLVAKNAKIVIGNSVSIGSYSIIYAIESTIEVGDNSYINHNVEIIGKYATVKTGSDVLVGMDVLITTYNHGFNDLNTPIRKQKGSGENIVIEDNVWIGAKSVILPGVRIGKNSIIGAGSIVTKNIRPNSIVAGNPAKLIRIRKQI